MSSLATQYFASATPKAKIKIRQATNGQFYFVLYATNGEALATSEMYVTKSNAVRGAETFKQNATSAVIEE